MTPQKIQKVFRVLGSICLSTSLIMIISGLSAFQGKLKGWGFILYWSVCFLFAIGSAVFALLEIVFIRKMAQRAYKELVDECVSAIQKTQKQNSKNSEQSK